MSENREIRDSPNEMSILSRRMTLDKNVLCERKQACLRWLRHHPVISHARQKAFVAVPATDHNRA